MVSVLLVAEGICWSKDKSGVHETEVLVVFVTTAVHATLPNLYWIVCLYELDFLEIEKVPAVPAVNVGTDMVDLAGALTVEVYVAADPTKVVPLYVSNLIVTVPDVPEKDSIKLIGGVQDTLVFDVLDTMDWYEPEPTL